MREPTDATDVEVGTSHSNVTWTRRSNATTASGKATSEEHADNELIGAEDVDADEADREAEAAVAQTLEAAVDQNLEETEGVKEKGEIKNKKTKQVKQSDSPQKRRSSHGLTTFGCPNAFTWTHAPPNMPRHSGNYWRIVANHHQASGS